MKTFSVPTRETVSPANQQLFDKVSKGLGKVPNLFATMAYSENALGTYLALSGAKSALKAKEKEVINLVVSELNECEYCLSAHTAIAKLNGFTDEQILQIRTGAVPFDSKLDALAKLAANFVEKHGKVQDEYVDAFFAAGYTKEHLVDLIVAIGDKVITNFLHGVSNVPIDFPPAPALATVKA